MSLLSENVKTVISCQTLTAQNIITDELSTTSIVSDNIATNMLTLVDPNNEANVSTIEENGTTLEITAPTVKINGNAVVTGSLTVQTGVYTGPPIVINDVVAPHTHTLTFTNGLLSSYVYM